MELITKPDIGERMNEHKNKSSINITPLKGMCMQPRGYDKNIEMDYELRGAGKT
jgi:hypothetical protein